MKIVKVFILIVFLQPLDFLRFIKLFFDKFLIVIFQRYQFQKKNFFYKEFYIGNIISTINQLIFLFIQKIIIFFIDYLLSIYLFIFLSNIM